MTVLWLLLSASLAGSIGSLLPRMSPATTPRHVELVALTPWGTVPGLLAAAIGPMLLARHVGWPRAVSGIAEAVAIGALGVHIFWLAPLFVGERPQPAHGAPLVLMAQNLEFGDPHDVVRRVAKGHVDVLVLSDMQQPGLKGLLAAGVARQLPHDTGVTPGGPKGTVVFSRYPLTNETLISDGGDLRSITVENTPIGNIRLFALHPTPPYQGSAWAREYTWVTHALTDSAEQHPKRPSVIAGDLNATLDHLQLRGILEVGYNDALVQTNGGFQPTFPAFGTHRRLGLPIPPLIQIDHILTSNALVVTRVCTTHTTGSDHLGVIAHISRAPEGT